MICTLMSWWVPCRPATHRATLVGVLIQVVQREGSNEKRIRSHGMQHSSFSDSIEESISILQPTVNDKMEMPKFSGPPH